MSATSMIRESGKRPLRRAWWLLLATLCHGLLTAAEASLPVASPLDPQLGLGSWIWDETTEDRQECRFWRTVEIPRDAQVQRARLRIAGDNFYRVLLNGRDVGQGSDWRTLTEYDLTQLFQPGLHVLAVHGVNDFDAAGILLGLRVDLADGRRIEVGSDEGWRLVPAGERGWETRRTPGAKWRRATVVAALGEPPWKSAGYSAIAIAAPLTPLDTRFWQSGWFQASLATVCGGVILVCFYLVSRLVMQNQAQQVVRRERARIARDIHDELTAGLTKLVLLGETTQSDLPRASETRGQINQLCDQARGLLGSMNETIWVINSQRDTVRDLVSYVCKYAETFLRQTPVRCRFDIERELPEAPCDVGTRRNLFLAVKEALNNVLRHSGATEVFLRCQWRDEHLLVSVEDNGRGFDPARADPNRNGLSNMEQRALEVGGRFQVMSRPGKGCRVEFLLPLLRSPWWRLRGALSGGTTGKKDSSDGTERG